MKWLPSVALKYNVTPSMWLINSLSASEVVHGLAIIRKCSMVSK
jgi:hypothetical protein